MQHNLPTTLPNSILQLSNSADVKLTAPLLVPGWVATLEL